MFLNGLFRGIRACSIGGSIHKAIAPLYSIRTLQHQINFVICVGPMIIEYQVTAVGPIVSVQQVEHWKFL